MDQSTPCKLGNYASYSINVTGSSDIVAGLSFAQQNNVRLTIKNTGHEYVILSSEGVILTMHHHLVKMAKVPARERSHSGHTT